MADITSHSIIDLKISCSRDEAAARLLGWMQGPSYRHLIPVTEAGIEETALTGLHELQESLAEMLDGYRAHAAQKLFDAAEEGADYETLTTLGAEVERWDSITQQAHRYLLDMDQELDKGDNSLLKVDPNLTDADGKNYIKLHSLEGWANQKYSQQSESLTTTPDQNLDVTVKPGGLSKTKANSLFITLAFMVDALKLKATKYGGNDALRVDPMAMDIAQLAANSLPKDQKFAGQGHEAIKDRIEDAIKIKDAYIRNALKRK